LSVIYLRTGAQELTELYPNIHVPLPIYRESVSRETLLALALQHRIKYVAHQLNGLIELVYHNSFLTSLIPGKKRAEGKSPTAVGYAYFTHNITKGKQFQYPI
jgi:hypothetical protein